MDQSASLSTSVLERLLKTNRPPTDQERAIIQEAMAPTNAKLKAVEDQISDTLAYIQALKSQVEKAEIKLQRLRDEEAAILEISAEHRRALSPFRNLPGDVLQEICIACVKVDIPLLSYGLTPLPYVLAQISSGMRHIVMTTPLIWASMSFNFTALNPDPRRVEQIYSTLARKASEWLERAGDQALTIIMQDPGYDIQYGDPSNIVFDTLLSFSVRWKRMEFSSISRREPSAPLIRVAALTAVDVPLLESISFRVYSGISMLRNSTLLAIPTLKHLTMEAPWNEYPELVIISDFTINWAILTSITILTKTIYDISSIGAIARVLQQTKCLVSCDIAVAPSSATETSWPAGKIDLPFLKTLRVDEKSFEQTSSILDLFHTPSLAILEISEIFLEPCLSNFLKRTLYVEELSLFYDVNSNRKNSLAHVMKILRHCPSLSVLKLRSRSWSGATDPVDANIFLQAFVNETGIGGVICPRLRCFELIGDITFSLQTLHQFLEAKHRTITPQNALTPWKNMVIDMGAFGESETYQQMLDLVSQHQATGLGIRILPCQKET